MKVLVTHNRYRRRGGEDVVFENECELLRVNGLEVEELAFSSNDLKTPLDEALCGLGTFYNFSSAQIMEERIESFRPDVIHIHNFFPIASSSIFYAAKKHNIPVVHTVHTYRLTCANSFMLRDKQICDLCTKSNFSLHSAKYKCFQDSSLKSFINTMSHSVHNALGTWENCIDKLIFLTSFFRDNTLNNSVFKFDINKTIVKPNFVYDHGIGTDDREDYYVYVGRIDEEKGIEVLLNAFTRLPYRLKIIGTGEMVDKVLEAQKINPKIEYLGFQKTDYILEVLKKARALIFPSIWYETFGVTMIEAFSAGTPVIGSSIGSVPEIVDDGKTGFIFQYGNYEDLMRKVQAFHENENLQKEMRIEARKSYERRFTPEVNFKMMFDIYSSVLK